MTTTESITLAGIGLTFIATATNLFLLVKNSKKTTFINSITKSRIKLKYIQDLRDNISQLCSLVVSYKQRISKLSYEEYFELLKEVNRLKFLVRLHLTPTDEYWDNKILELTNEIQINENIDPTEKIEELIVITQFLLKLEWEGVKLESKKGIISESEKKKIYNKYVELYNSHTRKKVKLKLN